MGINLGNALSRLARPAPVASEPSAIAARLAAVRQTVDELAGAPIGADGRGKVALGAVNGLLRANGDLKAASTAVEGAQLGAGTIQSVDRDIWNAYHRIKDFTNHVEPGTMSGSFDPRVATPSLREASTSLRDAVNKLRT